MPSNTPVPYWSAWVAIETFAALSGVNFPSRYATPVSAISCPTAATSFSRCWTVLAVPHLLKTKDLPFREAFTLPVVLALAARASRSSSRKELAENDDDERSAHENGNARRWLCGSQGQTRPITSSRRQTRRAS